jgi:hypothetical protein
MDNTKNSATFHENVKIVSRQCISMYTSGCECRIVEVIAVQLRVSVRVALIYDSPNETAVMSLRVSLRSCTESSLTSTFQKPNIFPTTLFQTKHSSTGLMALHFSITNSFLFSLSWT